MKEITDPTSPNEEHLASPDSRKDKEEILRCSFCNKSQREVKKLIAGPTCFICDECVDICLDIIGEDAALEIREAIPTAEYVRKVLDRTVIGQDRAKTVLANVLRNQVLRETGNGPQQEPKKTNILLFGPPGSGKNLTINRLAAILQIPISTIDALRLNGASYFKSEDVLENLFQKAGSDKALAECGIVCIDHLDRIVDKNGPEGEGVRIQESLLQVLEGSEVILEQSKTKLDTAKIKFVGCGVFSFLQSLPDRQSLSIDHLRRKELVKHGFLPEFVDRFGLIVEFPPLSEADLRSLLTSETGLLEEYRELFMRDQVDLKFDGNAVQAIAHEASRRGGGARSLRSILESIALEISFELTSHARPAQFTVDEALVSRCL